MTMRQTGWPRKARAAYGARPLKRVIQKEVRDPLAKKILLGEILDGSTVKITAGSDGLNFKSVKSLPEKERVKPLECRRCARKRREWPPYSGHFHVPFIR